jgi:predicted aldo/keto reductase-like oxidoreductase
MQYRLDPKSGNQLSVLGFGCMRFPRLITGQIDYSKSEKLLLDAIATGVNYFDTAYLYGGSEEILGKFFSTHTAPENLRSKIFLATKLPHLRCNSTEDYEAIF